MLNDEGKKRAAHMAEAFSALLAEVELWAQGGDGRSLAIAKTKLEEACFFAKRAMASAPSNQQP
jgi:hypothetical protein